MMIMIFDRKQDFYDLAKESDLLYFLLHDFQDNWCAPPDGVDDMTWFNVLAEILAVHFEYRMAGQLLLTDMLKKLSDKRRSGGQDYPTIKDLADHLLSHGEGSKI